MPVRRARHGVDGMSGAGRGYVLDVSRLVWMRWAGRRPTGIDRVCLAYLGAFAARSVAMVQRGRHRIILGERASDRLFGLLAHDCPGRLALAGAIGRGAALPERRGGQAGRIYLNVGHTGLDAPGLGAWIAARNLRAAIFVHDLIPITHPQFCRPGEQSRHRRRLATVLSGAHGVIVNSRDTRDRLGAYAQAVGMAAPATIVAPLGVDSALIRLPSPAEIDLAGRRDGQRDGPRYFLCVGTIEGRKNHQLLLDAWDRVRRALGPDAPDLVLVGRRGWEAEDVWRCLDGPQPLHGRVFETGDCGDAALRRLMIGCEALLMPSHAEGYGLPVVEALALGTPVVASDLAVFREIAGAAPLYLDPGAPDKWSRAIIAMLAAGRPARRAPLVAAPDWDSHFRLLAPWLAGLAPAGVPAVARDPESLPCPCPVLR